MSDFSIDDGNKVVGGQFTSRSIFGQAQTPKMVGLVMKMGVKSEKTAGMVLISIAVVSLIVTVIIVKMTLFPSYEVQTIYREDLSQEELENMDPGMLEGYPSKYEK